MASSSSTILKKSVALSIPSRLNETKDELKNDVTSVDQLPDALADLCLDYHENPSPTEEKVERKIEKIFYPRTTFFKKTLAQKLHEAADDLLLGYGNKALDLIKENPWLIAWKTEGSDRLGRCIKGRTLLQMAAMAGDLNLYEKGEYEEYEEYEEDHGMVELLAQAGKLSPTEIANQLSPVLFSIEAKKENDARKKAVLAVLIEFGESLFKRKGDLPEENYSGDDGLKIAQALCQPEINKLRESLLTIVSNQTITAGYILDSQINVELGQWVAQNRGRLGARFLFWVVAYGSLQYVSAARDAHIHCAGITPVVYRDFTPRRSLGNYRGPDLVQRYLKESDAPPHFSASSRLGLDFYFGDVGYRANEAERAPDIRDWQKLCRSKTSALLTLFDDPDMMLSSVRCVVM